MEEQNLTPRYASFGKRLAAHLIDYFIICFVTVNIYYFFSAFLNAYFEANPEIFKSLFPEAKEYEEYSKATIIALRVALVFSFFFRWTYYAGFESSPWQATPGKKLLGLYVMDVYGQRVSFLNATGRYFGKFVSSFILNIGYLVMLGSHRAQTLHDKMAGCVVPEK